MVRVFTGPSDLSERQAALVSAIIAGLEFDADIYRTGAANGVDTIAAKICLLKHPEANHSVYVPAAPHNEAVVRFAQARGAKILRCADRGTPAKSYRERNERMLDSADELVAILHRPEFYRSGEWMTVNIAERRGVRVRKFLLTNNRRS
jgi:hypothetical protein